MSAHTQDQIHPAAELPWSEDAAQGDGRLPVATSALVIVSISAALWYAIWQAVASLASLLA